MKHVMALVLGSFIIGGSPLQNATLRFEVASVKPSAANVQSSLDSSPGRFAATGQPLKLVIALAYNVTIDDVLSGPEWVEFEKWNIEAKAEEGSIPPRGSGTDMNSLTPMQLMLQALLEDRFQLVVHRENRAEPAYELVVGKGGPKFKRSDDQTPPGPSYAPPVFVFDRLSPPPRGKLKNFAGPTPGGIQTLVGKSVRVSDLAVFLRNFVDRPVNDKTGLTELYDVEMRFKWEPPGMPPDLLPKDEGPPAPSIFVALQEQLGLSLQSNAKAPRPVLVIDRVQRPSAN